MAFLVKEKSNTIIRITVIDKLTDGDDGIINTLIETAVDEMKSYLRSGYDLAIFTGEEGTMLLNMYCKDITLYHLFSRHNQSQIPLIRDIRYKQAIAWLNDVQAQKITVGLTLLTETEKALVQSGGNTKRNNHQDD